MALPWFNLCAAPRLVLRAFKGRSKYLGIYLAVISLAGFPICDLHGQSTFQSGQLPVPPPAFPPIQPRVLAGAQGILTNSMGVRTNSNEAVGADSITNFGEYSNPMEKQASQVISQLKRRLDQTNLPPQTRAYIESEMAQINAQMVMLRNMRKDMDKARSLHPLFGLPTNSEAPDTSVNLPANLQQIMADQETNSRLWANLAKAQVLARKSGDKEAAARAEAELVSYLQAQYGAINGKTYPPGMSLADIMKENPLAPALGGQRNTDPGKIVLIIDRRRAVIGLLSVMLVAPLLVLIYHWLKSRKA